MYYMASFAQAFIASQYPKLTPGKDYDSFAFPTIDPDHAGTVMVGADLIVMVNDTPAARSFMAYLAGTQAQKTWIALGGFTSVNRSVPPDTYPDAVARSIAQDLANAPAVRFSAGDTMPASVQRAWWNAMTQLVQDPRSSTRSCSHSATPPGAGDLPGFAEDEHGDHQQSAIMHFGTIWRTGRSRRPAAPAVRHPRTAEVRPPSLAP
jgi:hypothetical protein